MDESPCRYVDTGKSRASLIYVKQEIVTRSGGLLAENWGPSPVILQISQTDGT